MKPRCTNECAEDFKKVAAENAALIMAAARRKADYTAWLIEINETSGPTYFQMSDDDDWTNDHNKALHFGRKQDAESVIAYYGWTRAQPVEHMWPH